MNDKDLQKLLKTDPYHKYLNDRTKELINKLAKSIVDKDSRSWLEFVAKVCYRLSFDEMQLLEYQAIMTDDSFKGCSDPRLKLLKSFNQNYVHDIVSRHNQTLADFDKKGGDVK